MEVGMTYEEATRRLVEIARESGGKVTAAQVEADPELSTDQATVSAAARALGGGTNVFSYEEEDGRDWFPFAGLVFSEKYVRLGPFTFEHGRQSTLDLLSLTPRPDAIFSSSVILTTGVLWSLRARRVRWPEDIAVVGFGDAAWASLVTPTLTVVEQPARQLGEVAAQLLMSASDGTAQGQQLVLESHLVLRESHRRLVGKALGG